MSEAFSHDTEENIDPLTTPILEIEEDELEAPLEDGAIEEEPVLVPAGEEEDETGFEMDFLGDEA